ncbi:protein of unknown function DUF389 [Thermosynechococcus sp. NK55a]|jgi:uncharacterized hydrophobic protein (TIGR00271 family)|uniref:DUF389 domain-containing protein n=1 Tax=unclassified Thermosynechococcus TaxID=2622553 RepID=UPI0003D81951|nr:MULTISPECIES: DUF389 domain-containing protein [unclassified Thermosynechococcus]AHB87908.1 protein of unknown function DUF389 [Thermosynechococcus sp. NK55a]RMH65420.1 MAG: DUF389 domain-containing protein [Cyanobacteria bacterium J003]HIK23621.1 DUF389 domain-containing protein [Thermosynechococcus sp. M3746_W2019_013]
MKELFLHWLHQLQAFRYHRRKPESLDQLTRTLDVESRLSVPYIVLIVTSCAIATLGLLANSAAVIIGAMIIAPLMAPIRGLAFASLSGNIRLFREAAFALGTGTLLAIGISWLIGLFVRLEVYGSEIMARSQPTLLDLGIAVVAGVVSAYAIAEPRISNTLAGTAIAVALMPPVCTIGLGLAQGNARLTLGAILLYLTNLLGIALACMVFFVITGYIPLHRSRRPLLIAGALTAVLVVPLAISFSRLLQQARLQYQVRQALVRGTLTFQRLDLLSSETDWVSDPPIVLLNVRAREPVTPKQVRLMEEFIHQHMGRPFRLVLQVSSVQEVTAEESTP